MTFWSMMMVKVLEGKAEAAAQVWIKNRIVEAAAETIPGFLVGEVMLSTDEPNQVCVMCGWEDKAAYEGWQNSPVRAKITTDLSGAVSADIKTVCFQSIHTVSSEKG